MGLAQIFSHRIQLRWRRITNVSEPPRHAQSRCSALTRVDDVLRSYASASATQRSATEASALLLWQFLSSYSSIYVPRCVPRACYGCVSCAFAHSPVAMSTWVHGYKIIVDNMQSVQGVGSLVFVTFGALCNHIVPVTKNQFPRFLHMFVAC